MAYKACGMSYSVIFHHTQRRVTQHILIPSRLTYLFSNSLSIWQVWKVGTVWPGQCDTVL